MGRKKLKPEERKRKQSFKLSPESIVILEELAGFLGLSKARILEISISRFGVDSMCEFKRGENESS